MKDLFQQIEIVIPKIGNWCTVEKAHSLAAIVIALRPETTVEIGVFSGSSLFSMAMAHKHIGIGKVIGVDPWDAKASIEGMEPPNVDWWSKVDHEAVFQTFMQNRSQLGLSEIVRVVRMKSDDYTPPDSIDLFHCDGNHSDQAVKDVKRYATKVRVGGICVMDDINWSGGGVARAVEKLKDFGFKELYPLGSGAVYQRVSR